MRKQLRAFGNMGACLLAGYASIAAAAAAQTRYAVTDLGVLPGNDLSVATGLNDQGDVAGYCMAGGNQVACAWHNGTIRSPCDVKLQPPRQTSTRI